MGPSDAEIRSRLAAPGFFRAPGPDYPSIAAHTADIDALLGVRVEETEAALLEAARRLDPTGNVDTWGKHLHDGRHTWVGLPTCQLQTPYDELDRMCRLIAPRPDASLVDLGTGYGRLGLVWGHHCPAGRFSGFELVPERWREAHRVLGRFALCEAEVLCRDLTDPTFTPPAADGYFMYDYAEEADIARTLAQLGAHAARRPFFVVGRGSITRRLLSGCAHLPFRSHAEVTFSVYQTHAP